MSMQIREGRVAWTLDLNASTASTVFPTTSTQGIATGQYRHGSRVHVKIDHTVATGVVSLFVALYGYTTGDATAAGSGWYFLGAFNNASSMAANTSQWSPDASTIRTAEVFTISDANYDRLYTRQIAPGGTTPNTTTYIGFPTE
jgi:hypothetical protein